MADTHKRPWIAALLAIVYPGLGHVYLRSWQRGLLWFGAVVLTAIVFIPATIFEGVGTVADAVAATGAIPIEATIAISLVTLFNVIDAYLTAKRSNAAVGERHCEQCGRVVDEDLSFCYWCTAELAPKRA